jgi:hypothetical protein
MEPVNQRTADMADQPLRQVLKASRGMPGPVIDADAKRHNEQVLEARRRRRQRG